MLFLLKILIPTDVNCQVIHESVNVQTLAHISFSFNILKSQIDQLSVVVVYTVNKGTDNIDLQWTEVSLDQGHRSSSELNLFVILLLQSFHTFCTPLATIQTSSDRFALTIFVIGTLFCQFPSLRPPRFSSQGNVTLDNLSSVMIMQHDLK